MSGLKEEIQTELNSSEEQKELETFLNDKEQKDGALSLASAFYDYMGSKWFTVDKLCHKTGMDRLQAIQKLQMCKAFGHVNLRMGNSRDERDQLRQPLFKVTIKLEDKISALDGIIQYHLDAVEDFQLQRKIFITELEEKNSKKESL